MRNIADITETILAIVIGVLSVAVFVGVLVYVGLLLFGAVH